MAERVERNEPSVEIIEQPRSHNLRFRYQVKKQSASLTGVSTAHAYRKDGTFPAIRIRNFCGNVVVVISCVTRDPPYYPHPHRIVITKQIRENPNFRIADGVFQRRYLVTEDTTLSFPWLGIECVRRAAVYESLQERQRGGIDPFNTKFAHLQTAAMMDLHSLRLCFQVFLEEEGPGLDIFQCPLRPVLSNIIYDSKAVRDLSIIDVSHSVLPIKGDEPMLIFCGKVCFNEIQVCFYKENDTGVRLWEEVADVNFVYRQMAVAFKTPDCTKHLAPGETKIRIKVTLRRGSTGGEEGEGHNLVLTASPAKPPRLALKLKRKRPNLNLRQVASKVHVQAGRRRPSALTPTFHAGLCPSNKVQAQLEAVHAGQNGAAVGLHESSSSISQKLQVDILSPTEHAIGAVDKVDREQLNTDRPLVSGPALRGELDSTSYNGICRGGRQNNSRRGSLSPGSESSTSIDALVLDDPDICDANTSFSELNINTFDGSLSDLDNIKLVDWSSLEDNFESSQLAVPKMESTRLVTANNPTNGAHLVYPVARSNYPNSSNLPPQVIGVCQPAAKSNVNDHDVKPALFEPAQAAVVFD